ncbi:TIGR04222 domain-containing membrane protein [Nonomuraea sp. SYSU D8015]|uniref:TIGR04222 domain-containing membrane protein n=1 Tax=Nonomuraea sp. SYSU D8015 TaxID=2593644 RepID=UPI001660105A|nr:TIGR04222 domain-containing membrane protein [Nonomuraea sp. SYSU D8015]
MELILLIVSVALAALSYAAASAIKHEHAALRAAAPASRPRALGHYELAYLAGGPDRAAGTAIALLAESGHLRVSRGGRVHQVHAGAVSHDPLEEAVLGVIASRSGLPAVALRIETTRTLAMDALKRRLTELGLLHPDDAFTRAGRLSGLLRALSVAAFACGVLAAVTMLVLNVTLLPSLALVVLALTGLGGLVAIIRHRNAAMVRLTPSGRETIEAARRDNPLGAAEGPVAVALYGLGELRDPDLQMELTESHGRRRGGGAYVGGASSCGGGGGAPPAKSTGDGSPGCGGGGCGGGCGGGG